MFFQLGNIIFKGLFSPSTLNVEGDEASYAEHNLIGGRPRLKKTGDTLQTLSLECMFHAEFCNPSEQIGQLKNAKDNGEILPLLMGNGRYVNDYVITSFPYEVLNAFDDGTIIRAKVTINITEYVAYNRLERIQQLARVQAFARGDRKPLTIRPPQPFSLPKTLAVEVTATKLQSVKIDSMVSDFKNNVAQRQSIGMRIQDAAGKAQKAITAFNTKLEQARSLQSDFNQIKSNAQSALASAKAVADNFPYTSLDKLQALNGLLQGNVSAFGSSSAIILKRVAVRQPLN